MSRLTVPSLRNGLTIFAIFCRELATVCRYVCPEGVLKKDDHSTTGCIRYHNGGIDIILGVVCTSFDKQPFEVLKIL